MSSTPMLKVERLDAWYDRSHVVQGLGFEVGRGEIVRPSWG
jgi:branched-chain amino acid transport system ATP-binding protein